MEQIKSIIHIDNAVQTRVDYPNKRFPKLLKRTKNACIQAKCTALKHKATNKLNNDEKTFERKLNTCDVETRVHTDEQQRCSNVCHECAIVILVNKGLQSENPSSSSIASRGLLQTTIPSISQTSPQAICTDPVAENLTNYQSNLSAQPDQQHFSCQDRNCDRCFRSQIQLVESYAAAPVIPNIIDRTTSNRQPDIRSIFDPNDATDATSALIKITAMMNGSQPFDFDFLSNYTLSIPTQYDFPSNPCELHSADNSYNQQNVTLRHSCQPFSFIPSTVYQHSSPASTCSVPLLPSNIPLVTSSMSMFNQMHSPCNHFTDASPFNALQIRNTYVSPLSSSYLHSLSVCQSRLLTSQVIDSTPIPTFDHSIIATVNASTQSITPFTTSAITHHSTGGCLLQPEQTPSSTNSNLQQAALYHQGLIPKEMTSPQDPRVVDTVTVKASSRTSTHMNVDTVASKTSNQATYSRSIRPIKHGPPSLKPIVTATKHKHVETPSTQYTNNCKKANLNRPETSSTLIETKSHLLTSLQHKIEVQVSTESLSQLPSQKQLGLSLSENPQSFQSEYAGCDQIDLHATSEMLPDNIQHRSAGNPRNLANDEYLPSSSSIVIPSSDCAVLEQSSNLQSVTHNTPTPLSTQISMDDIAQLTGIPLFVLDLDVKPGRLSSLLSEHTSNPAIDNSIPIQTQRMSTVQHQSIASSVTQEERECSIGTSSELHSKVGGSTLQDEAQIQNELFQCTDFLHAMSARAYCFLEVVQEELSKFSKKDRNVGIKKNN